MARLLDNFAGRGLGLFQNIVLEATKDYLLLRSDVKANIVSPPTY
jgi:hypothetical protein